MQGGYGGGGGGGYGGAPPGGGGWGPPPGGAPPPGGGYGQPPPGGAPPGGYGQPPGGPPPGGGYGAPGGGFGGPPGGGFGQNPYGAPGTPGAPGPQQTGMGRFFKSAVIGGVIGGVLSSIPLLNILNCCFCLLNMAGAIIGLQMYLKENPQEQLSNGDAASCGAISGATTGVVAGILGMIVSAATGGGANLAALKALPPDVARNIGPMMAGGILWGLIAIPIGMIIYGAFGALGGVLGMTLFFKDRARS